MESVGGNTITDEVGVTQGKGGKSQAVQQLLEAEKGEEADCPPCLRKDPALPAPWLQAGETDCRTLTSTAMRCLKQLNCGITTAMLCTKA